MSVSSFPTCSIYDDELAMNALIEEVDKESNPGSQHQPGSGDSVPKSEYDKLAQELDQAIGRITQLELKQERDIEFLRRETVS